MRGLDFLHFSAYNGTMNYTQDSTDQYMRDILADELTPDEADNALTAMSTLTGVFSSYFPIQRTFTRPHRTPGYAEATGVRILVFGEDGIERSVHIPRADLSSVAEAVESAMLTASIWILPV